MFPTVSVIVPVYNAEHYLRKCIDSVLCQSLTSIELILVDDGSTDRSLKICKEFESRDTRVKVVSKKNGGVSSARNLGLDVAQGEWVLFLDADDYWLETTILENLISIAKKYSLDIVRGEYISVNEYGEQIYPRDYSEKTKYQDKALTSAEFLKNIVCGEFFLVLNLIKRTVIGNVRFDTNQIFLEDMKFLMQLLSMNLKCGYIPISFYAYRKIQTSASNKFNLKKLADSFGMTGFFKDIATKVDDIELKRFCQYYAIMMYCWTLQTVSENPYYEHRKKVIREIQLNTLCKNLLKYLKDTGITILFKYKVILNVKPILGIYICRYKANITSFIRR